MYMYNVCSDIAEIGREDGERERDGKENSPGRCTKGSRNIDAVMLNNTSTYVDVDATRTRVAVYI